MEIMKKLRVFLAALLIVTPVITVAAETVYLEREAFLQQVFAGDVPAPATYWFVGDKKLRATKALGVEPLGLRTRYWATAKRSAWVMEAIGKEMPITVGIVVENDAITQLEILTYRETRGWEVQLAAFRQQFTGAKARKTNQLDRHIDGISGATLSVRAVTGLSRLALALHAEIMSATK